MYSDQEFPPKLKNSLYNKSPLFQPELRLQECGKDSEESHAEEG